MVKNFAKALLNEPPSTSAWGGNGRLGSFVEVETIAARSTQSSCYNEPGGYPYEFPLNLCFKRFLCCDVSHCSMSIQIIPVSLNQFSSRIGKSFILGTRYWFETTVRNHHSGPVLKNLAVHPGALRQADFIETHKKSYKHTQVLPILMTRQQGPNINSSKK